MGENSSSTSSQAADSALNDPAHLAFLLGKIGKTEFQTARGHYPAPKVRPQRKPHNFTSAQSQAYEFIKSWIHDLSEGFTAAELKRAFRRAAIILHPDHGGNTQQFLELKAHYETLKTIVA